MNKVPRWNLLTRETRCLVTSWHLAVITIHAETAWVPGCASLVHHVRIPCAIHNRTKCDGRAPSRSGGTRTTCVYARASRVVTLPLRQARRGAADLPARWRPWTGWPEAAGRRRSAPAQGRRRRRWRRRPQIRCRRRRSSIQKMATKHQILIAKGSREDDPPSRLDECTYSEPHFHETAATAAAAARFGQ